MEAIELKICSYLNCEKHFHLGLLLKENAKSEHNFGRFVELQRLIHMYPSGASQPAVVYKEPLFVDEH